jgi:exonuclease III
MFWSSGGLGCFVVSGDPFHAVTAFGPVLSSSMMFEQQCVILNWNARGLNNPARRQVVRNLVSDSKATIVTIQETKIEAFDSTLVNETLGNNFVEHFAVLPSVGLSGGILLAVNSEHYSISAVEVGVHTITAVISTSTASESWCLTAVYGPQGDNEKLQFLGELRWVSTTVLDKWLVIGDFNLILQAADKSNTNLIGGSWVPLGM